MMRTESRPVQPPPLHDRLRRQSPRTHKVCEAYLGGKYNLEMVTSIKTRLSPETTKILTLVKMRSNMSNGANTLDTERVALGG
jgi:hypothetical protein